MAVRAKFQVVEHRAYAWDAKSAKPGKEVILQPHYDTSIPEDQRFCDATPSGKFAMRVNNPEALAQLELGRYFYVTLTPCEDPLSDNERRVAQGG